MTKKSSPDEEPNKLYAALMRNLEDISEIKKLRQVATLEVRDLDEITTKENIWEAVITLIPGAQNIEKGKVKTIHKAYGGTEIAVVSANTNGAESPRTVFQVLRTGAPGQELQGPDR